MTLTELEEWIEDFPTHIPEIKEVIFGDEQEILNRQNSRIQYPCMWVETPSPRLVYNPPGMQYSFFCTFLMNVPNEGDKTQYRAARNTCILNAQRAFARFERGEEAALFELQREAAEGEEIWPYSGDRDTGFRFQIRLTVGRDDC
jgi:hypothetical protein